MFSSLPVNSTWLGLSVTFPTSIPEAMVPSSISYSTGTVTVLRLATWTTTRDGLIWYLTLSGKPGISNLRVCWPVSIPVRSSVWTTKLPLANEETIFLGPVRVTVTVSCSWLTKMSSSCLPNLTGTLEMVSVVSTLTTCCKLDRLVTEGLLACTIP